MRGRRLAQAGLVLLAAQTTACSDAVDPGGGPLAVAVGLTLDAAAGGVAEAYASVDAIAVEVRAGGAVVFDETQPFTPETGETRVRVRLDQTLAGSAVTVAAELLGSGAPLFRGSASTTLEETGASTLNVPLNPVVSGVVVTNPVATFTAIGETLALSAAAVFATGDTVPNVPITWRSLDPSIVTVGSGGGSATSQTEGTARLEASAEGATAATTAVVAAQVSRITVTPPTATVSIGQSAAFSAQAFDRNGNGLTRTFEWSATPAGIATVTSAGVATGSSAGVANVVAAAGGAQGSAVLTVVNVPIAPGDVTGEILSQATLQYRLQWADLSINETYFSIERQAGGSGFEEVGRTEPDETTFEATGVPGPNDFRVRACNTNGCSAPSNTVRLTFLAGPPVATTLEPAGLGVMTGTVSSVTPYTVVFQYGFGEEDFEEGGSDGECPCYYETDPIEAVGTQQFTVPVEDWYDDYPLYYRIVAVNEYGEDIGDLESDSIPDIDTGATSSTWDYGSSVTLQAELFVPTGGGGNPIESVRFELRGINPSYFDELNDGTASESTTSGGRIYSYSRTWRAPLTPSELAGTVSVDVIVTFSSGATVYAGSLAIFYEPIESF